jgi:hypothetical protein
MMIWKPWSHPAYGVRDFIRVEAHTDGAWISVFKSGEKWHCNTSIWTRSIIPHSLDSKMRSLIDSNPDVIKSVIDFELKQICHHLLSDAKFITML